MFIYVLSLVGAPLRQITASVQRGIEVISLWQCWGIIEAQVVLIAAFSSPVLLGRVLLIFLLTVPHNLYGVQVRRVGWLVKHSNIMARKPVSSSFGTVGKC